MAKDPKYKPRQDSPKRCRAPLATALQNSSYSRRAFLSTAIAAPVLIASLPKIATASSAEIAITSPDGKIRFELFSDPSQLRYRVNLSGKTVVGTSQMGIIVANVDLGRDIAVGTTTHYRIRETYASRAGAMSCLTGIAARKSIEQGQSIRIKDLARL